MNTCVDMLIAMDAYAITTIITTILEPTTHLQNDSRRLAFESCFDCIYRRTINTTHAYRAFQADLWYARPHAEDKEESVREQANEEAETCKLVEEKNRSKQICTGSIDSSAECTHATCTHTPKYM